jgi:hypothetical protein
MKATSNPDAALHRALNGALRQFGAREIILRYLASGSVRWIATALIDYHRVVDKLRADLSGSLSLTDVTAYNDQPIARGEGATALDAIRALTAVTWRAPHKP